MPPGIGSHGFSGTNYMDVTPQGLAHLFGMEPPADFDNCYRLDERGDW